MWIETCRVICGMSVCLVRTRLVGILQVVSSDEFGGVIKLHGKEP